MDFGIFIKGLIIGFSIAAPVGPIGVLCIQRTLNIGKRAGLVSGLGAATADAFYGCIAGFGLTLISSVLIEHQQLIRITGGAFLLYLGFKTFISKPAKEAASIRNNGTWSNYLSTLFLTLTNPMTILSFVAIFAGLGIVSKANDYISALFLVLGVFIGSSAWWLMLSSGVSILKKQLNNKVLNWINKLSGIVIVSFGIWALVSVL